LEVEPGRESQGFGVKADIKRFDLVTT